MFSSIVCGVDSQEGCIPAVRLAARLAREHSAALTLLHVDEAAGEEPLFSPPAAHLEKPRVGHLERLAAMAADLRGAPVDVDRATGDPAQRLIERASRGCDLLVIGSHAHSRAVLALASVAGKVVTHAPCPVLIVPPGVGDLKPDFPGQVA